ncbi:MAG TPA: thrombospondin type 3 repeat-containing protein, partial [Dehalococcoidia bacterium]|nr:thrombospondin type 3 repeat-containing protein [Dehalococcoidia bacterium]
MPTGLCKARTLAAVITAFVAVLVLAFQLTATQATHDPGAMAAMAIDMDPGASPANTATSLGTREFCARIDQNGALDADEDAVDAVQFDVTADAIPPETAMIAFSYTIQYDETALRVQSHDANFLLASASGSTLLDASDPVPDIDGSNAWTGTEVDLSTTSTESGSGILDRAVVAANPNPNPGLFRLHLVEAGHVDTTNASHGPEAQIDGFMALGQACPLEEPTPEPTIEPTSQPLGGALGIDHSVIDGQLAINDGPAIALPIEGTTVAVVADPPPGGLSAWSVDLRYDPAVVIPRFCSSGVRCGPEDTPGVVALVGADDPPNVAELALGDIGFRAVGSVGQCSDLSFAVDIFSNPDGINYAPEIHPGRICIGEGPTPTPLATPTPTPSPTPPGTTPTPAPTPVTQVSDVPPPYNPNLMLCLEQFESPAECDGDTSPGATPDFRIRFCLDWNADCSARAAPADGAFYQSFTAFIPPAFTVTPGSALPIGALLSHVDAETSLGIISNPCSTRLPLQFTLLNSSIDTRDISVGNPVADTNRNRIPDGVEHYPRFAIDAIDPDFANYGPDLLPGTTDDVNGPLPPPQAVARLFGVTALTPFDAVVVQAVVLPPGSLIRSPEGPLRPDRGLGYPVVIVLNDPNGPTPSSSYTDICSPFLADLVVFGQTRDNPCTPVLPAGEANCYGQTPQFRRSIPLSPCDPVNTLDEDRDGVINDGCPQVGQYAESGSECLDVISNDSEDSDVNDGCPQIGALSEAGFIPDPDGCDADGNEASCAFIRNPTKRGAVDITMYTASLPDADGDGIDNSLDTCPYTPNPDWDPRYTRDLSRDH